MNTKEQIFDVSLDLFSKKGYDSVSLREIAEEVGIRKSSIYSHYSSKEAILMDIFNYLRNLFEYDELLYRGSEAIKAMFSEERNLKIWKLIFIQMNHNDKIRLFFQDEILVKPLIFWKGFFSILKENGIIREDCNPELLAKEYYSFPIYLLLEICAKYDDIPESTLENFFEEAEEHANFLLDCVKVK